jgi:hypothetical protein
MVEPALQPGPHPSVVTEETLSQTVSPGPWAQAVPLQTMIKIEKRTMVIARTPMRILASFPTFVVQPFL